MENQELEFFNIQQDISAIPKVENIRFEHLQGKYLNIMNINNALVFVLGLVGLLYLWYMDDKSRISPYFQWILISYSILYILSLILLYKGFTHKAYAFRNRDISYKSGWLWRRITTVPFNRVQHCEVSQGILDRYFGLAKIKIFTAGGAASDISIPGLNLEEANDLKHYILHKIEVDG